MKQIKSTNNFKNNKSIVSFKDNASIINGNIVNCLDTNIYSKQVLKKK